MIVPEPIHSIQDEGMMRESIRNLLEQKGFKRKSNKNNSGEVRKIGVKQFVNLP